MLEAGEPELDLELELEQDPEPDPEPELEPELEVARAAKEVITGMVKCGRKREIATLEAGEPELEVAWMIEAQVTEDQIAAREVEMIALFFSSYLSHQDPILRCTHLAIVAKYL